MKNEIQNLTENEYIELLNTAKAQINAARNAIAVQVNSTANSTYWNSRASLIWDFLQEICGT